MKASSIIFALSICAPSTFAEQPTLESLALKVEALERKVELLNADLDTAKKQKNNEEDSDKTKRPEFIITILKGGKILVEGQELRDEELTSRIRLMVKKFPNQAFRIKADGEVNAQEILKVTDLCHSAGASNLSFGTKKH